MLTVLGVSAADGSTIHGARPRRQVTAPVAVPHKKAGRTAAAARDRTAGDRTADARDRIADDAATSPAGHSATRATIHEHNRAAGRAATREDSRSATREAQRDAARPRARGRETQPPARQNDRSRSRAKSYRTAEYRDVDLRSPAGLNSAARSRHGTEFYRAAKFSLAMESRDAEPPATVKEVSLRTERIPMPPPLLGSFASLERQNERTEADGLERIEDEADLNDRISRKMLVPLPVSPALGINGNLPQNRRYCRPWTATFLADLTRAHAAQFRRSLEVSSAVRTVEYQKQLAKVNGNAASAEGDIASPHLTGATIDIAKKGLTEREIGWMRAWLLPLQEAGKIDVEEEFQQSCFHITVYKSYAAPERRTQPADPRPQQATSSPSPSSSF